MKWMESAVCAEIGVEVFFPVKGDTKTSHRAKAICRTCPVIAEALRQAARLVEPGSIRPAGAPSTLHYSDLLRLADLYEREEGEK